MASKNETGHAKNVANLNTLISFCKRYGAAYKPSKKALSIEELERLSADANAALENVKTTYATLTLAVDRRQSMFKDFQSYSTRVLNLLASSDASKETVTDARSINRKIQGKRAISKPKEEGAESEGKSISVSQQSFDLMTDHFAKFIALVKQEPSYKPNETEFSTEGMEARYTAMKEANSGVVEAFTGWGTSRINRTAVFYRPLTGLVPLAQEVKKYIKGVFGQSSEQYQQVSGISFTAP